MKDIESALDLNAVVAKRTRGGRSPVNLPYEKDNDKNRSISLNTKVNRRKDDIAPKPIPLAKLDKLLSRAKPVVRELEPSSIRNHRGKSKDALVNDVSIDNNAVTAQGDADDNPMDKNDVDTLPSVKNSSPLQTYRRPTRNRRSRTGNDGSQCVNDNLSSQSPPGSDDGKNNKFGNEDDNVDISRDGFPSPNGHHDRMEVSTSCVPSGKSSVAFNRKSPSGIPGGITLVDVSQMIMRQVTSDYSNDNDPNNLEFLYSMWEFALVCHLCCLLRQEPVHIPEFNADELSKALVSTPLPTSPQSNSRTRDSDSRSTTIFSYEISPLLCAILFYLCPDAVAANANASGKMIDVTTFGCTSVSQDLLKRRLDECWDRYFYSNPLECYCFDELSAKGRCLILRALCEQRLTDDDVITAFSKRDDCNGYPNGEKYRIGSLFVSPLGRDIDGNEFWHLSDDYWLYLLFPSPSSATAQLPSTWQDPQRIIDLQRILQLDDSRKWMRSCSTIDQIEEFVINLSSSVHDCEIELRESLKSILPLLQSQEKQRRQRQGNEKRSLRQQLAGFNKKQDLELSGKDRLRDSGNDVSDRKSRHVDRHVERLQRQAEKIGMPFVAADVKSEIDSIRRNEDSQSGQGDDLCDMEITNSLEKIQQETLPASSPTSSGGVHRASTTAADDAASDMACICSVNEHEGLMVQCERCLFWLHARCLGFMNDSDIPDGYFCKKCVSSGKRMIKHPEPLAVGVLGNLKGSKRDLLKVDNIYSATGAADGESLKKKQKKCISSNNNNSSNKRHPSDNVRKGAKGQSPAEPANGDNSTNNSENESVSSEDSPVDDTKCVCDLAVHSGLMVECEKCLKWSHAECYGWFKEARLPTKFLCHLCGGPGVELHKLNHKDRLRVQARERDRKRRIKLISAKERSKILPSEKSGNGKTVANDSLKTMNSSNDKQQKLKKRDIALDTNKSGGVREMESAAALLLSPDDDENAVSCPADSHKSKKHRKRNSNKKLKRRDGFNVLLTALGSDDNADSGNSDEDLMPEVYIDPFDTEDIPMNMSTISSHCQKLYRGSIMLPLSTYRTTFEVRSGGNTTNPNGNTNYCQSTDVTKNAVDYNQGGCQPDIDGSIILPISDNGMGLYMSELLRQSMPIVSTTGGMPSVPVPVVPWGMNGYPPAAMYSQLSLASEGWDAIPTKRVVASSNSGRRSVPRPHPPANEPANETLSSVKLPTQKSFRVVSWVVLASLRLRRKGVIG